MKKIIFAIMQLIVIALTLALVLSTYAWFRANMDVDARPVTVTAGTPSYINLAVEDGEDDLYSGQTGQGAPGDEDAPYFISKKITVAVLNNSNLNNNAAISFTIDTVSIKKSDGDVVVIDREDIPELFTWRITYSTAANPENKIYCRPDDNMFVRVVLPPDEGDALGDYLSPPLGETVLTFDLKLIFLGESNYRLWEQERYGEIEVYPFSNVGYMYSEFGFLAAIRLEVPPQ
jgi:hypothetical protein